MHYSNSSENGNTIHDHLESGYNYFYCFMLLNQIEIDSIPLKYTSFFPPSTERELKPPHLENKRAFGLQNIMADVSFFVGIIGNIISILMFLSPVPTFWKIKKHRSTEDFSSLPYICTLLNCSLWTYYGIIKSGEYLVSTVNGFGIVVETIYIILFLIYAPKGIRAKTAILAVILDVIIFAAAIVTTLLALQGEARSDAVGTMGAGLNIVMYSSPLSIMKTVVATKSVEYMPFLLSFFFFLNGGVWLLYSFLVRDVILGVPNGTGFLLGAIQLVLYAIYRNGEKRVSINRLEEGMQHEPLITASHPIREDF
ncbi:hypothetical protein VNO78_04695 [Psophocarpus tetragonolobus]|uniref:Bidirectional sugar transporter SWEET n=1 Tax=Psophocarpus tetragonolobus TaxID=3891 RepID=A0AAN9T244_PSOTE